MRFNVTLLFGTLGVLSTGGKERVNSGELHAVRMELQAAYEEISSLTLEIVHLKEELDSSVQFYLCSVVVEYRVIHVSCCQSPLFFPKGSEGHTVALSHGPAITESQPHPKILDRATSPAQILETESFRIPTQTHSRTAKNKVTKSHSRSLS